MRGSSGNDDFIGGYGDDVLVGGAGNDHLEGGSGGDILTGGTGRDVFDFTDYSERWRVDDITDFRRGSDRLLFSVRELGFDKVSDVRLYLGANPSAPAGHPALLFETDTHRLWVDADGSGGTEGPDLIAVLDGVSRLSLSDFLFS